MNDNDRGGLAIDDNCNLVNNNTSSSHSSPSRSHLSLNLSSKSSPRKTNTSLDRTSKHLLFASHRSNSTPSQRTDATEAESIPQRKLEAEVDLLDVVTKCPICNKRESNPEKMELHINKVSRDWETSK